MKAEPYVDSSDEVRIICGRTRLQKWLQQSSSASDQVPVDLQEEGVDHDLSLMAIPEKIRLKYQHDYDRGAYGAWPKEMPFLKAYEIFAYCGHQYMIKPSEYYSGYGLFI